MAIETLNYPFSMIENSSSTAVIVIIERRALIRECLSRCLGDEIGCPVVAFADVESWQKVSRNYRALLIVFSAIGTSKVLEDQRINEVIRQLNLSKNGVPLTVLSDTDEFNHVGNSLRQGVRGHIPAATTLDVVVKAMQLVLVGGIYTPASNFLGEQSSVAKVGSREKKWALTERQNDVLDRVRQGKATKVIARELNISEHTVKVHLRTVMKKLGAKNRTEAAIRANDAYVPVPADPPRVARRRSRRVNAGARVRPAQAERPRDDLSC